MYERKYIKENNNHKTKEICIKRAKKITETTFYLYDLFLLRLPFRIATFAFVFLVMEPII